ncbi:NACHT and WD repeat domain-containing protein 2-like protein [Leptotrombidium deliense]|uniref:NACHT and WD repeat domain-containing protein 2-like protein n=1 Tax=Leptotrombidium deliense TaxID=299467 RepID=A0A443SK94_9ACAR|nr:NACHT and WD repeat domain-containing protein 2-like protein [Leptotrombidium deliense]
MIEVRELLDSCAMDESLRNKYLLSIQQQQVNFVLENEFAIKQTMLIKFESAEKETSEELQKLDKQLADHQKTVVSTASEETIKLGVEAIKLMLRKTVENTIEVQSQEESQSVYSGIESSLYSELIEQEKIRCDVTANLVVFESLLKKIELFISSPSNSTLVVYGPRGSGKSSFIAKVSHFVSLHFPSFVVIHRSVGVSEFSLTQEQLFRSIYEQCCALFGKYMEYARFHATESFVSTLKKITDDKQLLILIDGIDQFAPFHEFDLTAGSPLCTDFENIFGKLNMVEIPVLSIEENFDIFTQILNKKKRKISDAQKQAVAIAFQYCHSPVYAHLLANEAVYWCSDHLNNDSVIPKDASSLMNDVFIGSIFVNCWRTSFFKEMIVERIPHETLVASREMVHTFFKRTVNFDDIFEKAVNLIAAEEAPFTALMSNQLSAANEYIFHVNWLSYKLKTSDPFHFLEDIQLFERLYITEEDLELRLLKNFIIVSSYSLRYDASQIYSQVFARLNEFMSNQSNEVINKYPKMKSIFDYCCDQPKTSLFPLNVSFMSLTYDENGSPLAAFRENTEETFCFLFVIKANPVYIVSLSSDSGKIVVWDIYQEKPVRTLKGVNQPRSMQMIDEFRALVLCNRELKVYNLDSGVVESKLKGVMNQKMPFYGLHDDNYVVALSRNRMYVNMMNVVTGDLETQFKVGEDRFLNSLLVSANGKICVCGDETQKPFPLLVWDLSSRKLLYDLRIPHHEFVTHLAAISDDGHYVVSVCKELNSTAVNFIIVYDLQSGTLFKKWKPECNTCSIAISSQGGFVLNGIENCRILVWDLSTGAKRLYLSKCIPIIEAPVDTLQIDLSGKRCLSFDSLARDPSIRIWDAETGTCVAVFTPDHPLSCCQLTPDGQIVVFCFKKCTKLHTLALCTCKSLENERKRESKTYGRIDLNGSVFDLNES